MNTTKNLLIACIFTIWIVLVATFSIQNITLVSLKFFFFKSVEIPIGVLLSMILGLGFIVGAIVPLLFTSKNKARIKNVDRSKPKQFVRETEPDTISDW